jgi:HEAT repeat protein
MNNPKMVVSACLFAIALASDALAAEPTLPRDGWVSWEVVTTDKAPAFCCLSQWKKGATGAVTCNLDRPSDTGFGNRNDETTSAARIYARATAGQLDRLQMLAAACAVETQTPIRELAVDTDDSARWLIAQARGNGTDALTREKLAEGALMALAVHRGKVAGDSLAKFARDDARRDTREQAVFWLAQARGNEGADIVSSIMFNDASPDMREHAAFALSQSDSPRVNADLVRLGQSDKSGEVRAKAWFSLALTGAANAEQAIGSALRGDRDDEVREQAIFALSQLPDERAAKALIAAAEDQTLSREQRKRAIFWLSHAETPAAEAYLDKVLAR